MYSFNTDVFDLFLALFFGIVGYAFRKFDIPKAPLLFGLILGHTLEQSFRQALTISNGDPSVFLAQSHCRESARLCRNQRCGVDLEPSEKVVEAGAGSGGAGGRRASAGE